MQHQMNNPFDSLFEKLNQINTEISNIREASMVDKTTAVPQLLTTAEVIKLLHICRTTLWNWERNKILRPHRAGRRNLYKLEDIMKLIG